MKCRVLTVFDTLPYCKNKLDLEYTRHPSFKGVQGKLCIQNRPNANLSLCVSISLFSVVKAAL